MAAWGKEQLSKKKKGTIKKSHWLAAGLFLLITSIQTTHSLSIPLQLTLWNVSESQL